MLALSIFLSLAGSQRWSKLESIILDDPIQHLDDLDAVAFLENLPTFALGRLTLKRQILMSTCDLDLYLLMLRKFSGLSSEGSISEVFHFWSAEPVAPRFTTTSVGLRSQLCELADVVKSERLSQVDPRLLGPTDLLMSNGRHLYSLHPFPERSTVNA